MLKQCCAKDCYERPRYHHYHYHHYRYHYHYHHYHHHHHCIRFLELKRILADPFVPNTPRSPRTSSKISRNVNPVPSPSPAPIPSPSPVPAPIIITPPVTTKVTNYKLGYYYYYYTISITNVIITEYFIGTNLLFDGLITTSGHY